MPRLASRMLFGGGCYVMLLGIPVDALQQLVDPDFKAVVERPAYRLTLF